jgi:hypothetical protein
MEKRWSDRDLSGFKYEKLDGFMHAKAGDRIGIYQVRLHAGLLSQMDWRELRFTV